MSEFDQSKKIAASTSADYSVEKYDKETIEKLSKTLAENMEIIAKGLEDVHSDMKLLHNKHSAMPELFASLVNQLKPLADAAEEKK